MNIAVFNGAGASAQPAGVPADALVGWETIKLDNGLSAVLSPRDGLPMVAMEMRIPAGSIFDPAGSEGLSSLTAQMIRQGSIMRDAEAVDEFLDSRGAVLAVSASSDYVSVSLTCLSEDFPDVLSLAAELVLSPAFDEAEFKRIRTQSIERVRRSYGQGAVLSRDAFYRALYPHGGYGSPTDGYPASLEAITLERVVEFHSVRYRPGGSQISIVGPLSAPETLSLLNKTFGGWTPATPSPLRLDDTARPEGSPRVIIVDAPLAQANVRIGHRAPAANDPEYFRLRFVNEVLGGSGMTSRLGDTIRTKHGLAYSVFSWNAGWRGGGSFFIAFSTKVASARTAVDLAMGEVAALIADGPTQEEIQMTRAGLLGRLYFQLETYSGAAGQIAEAQWCGLGRDYFSVQQDTAGNFAAEDFVPVLARHVRPQDFVIVVAGPAAELEPQFADLGTVTVKPEG
ncbi:MAG: insulinase family protein [bacterium]|jgi:zinc protease